MLRSQFVRFRVQKGLGGNGQRRLWSCNETRSAVSVHRGISR